MAQSRQRNGNGGARAPTPRALDPTRQIIKIAHSAAPGNTPTGLQVGELGIDIASPPRLWVGCPPAIDVSGLLQLHVGGAFLPLTGGAIDGHLTVGAPTAPTGGILTGDINSKRAFADGVPLIPEPHYREYFYHQEFDWDIDAFSGAYLRVKSGDDYTWQSRIISEPRVSEEAHPVLHFMSNGAIGAVFGTQSYGQHPSVTMAVYRESVTLAWDLPPGPPALWLYATGLGYPLLIDAAGDLGILVNYADGNAGSRGIEIHRSANSGAGIRFTHKSVVGIAATPAEHLLGDIAWDGITERIANGNTRRREGARIQAISTQLWGANARGSRLEFFTTANNANAPRKALVLDHDGSLQILHNGTLTPLDSLLGGSSGLSAPTGPLVSSNGTVLGSLALGSNLSVSGTFPNQTLSVIDAIGLGWDNTWLGEDALALQRGGGNWEGNTAIGAMALSKAEPVNTAGNVAVGEYAAMNLIGTSASNVGVGFSVLLNLENGSANIAVGTNAGSGTGTSGMLYLTSAVGSIYIGSNAKPLDNNSINEIVIGWTGTGHGSNTITLGNDQITGLYCQETTITQLSDPRLKDGIEPADLDRCLAAVEDLPVHRYGWKDMAGARRDKHVTGWLPSEVAKIFPKAVSTHNASHRGALIEDCQYITMSEALPTLWGAVQRLSQKVRELEEERDG